MSLAANTVNVGTSPGDHTGDPGRTAWQKYNAALQDLYGAQTGASGLILNINLSPGAPALQSGYWDTALANAISTLTTIGSANGGTIQFGPGTYAFANAFPTPGDAGDNVKSAYPIALRGVGAAALGPQNSGSAPDPIGGTVLDFQCSATYGKIALANNMLLSIRDLIITATANFSTPLIYTTNPSLEIYNVMFWGQSGSARTCAQDAIILGGTTDTQGGHGFTDGFQGYGTGIRQCYFHRIRRCIQFRTFCNGIKVKGCEVWATCGSSNATDGAFIFNGGDASGLCVGNVCSDNLFEVTNYYYGIYMQYALNNVLHGNSFYDATSTDTFACIGCDSTCTYNDVTHGYVATIAGTGGTLTPFDDTGQYNSTGVTGSPTYVSGTSFTMTGNQTGTFYAGRWIRLVCSTRLIYAQVASSSYSSSTTVNITVFTGPSTGIDNTVSAVTVLNQNLQNVYNSNTQAIPSRLNYFEVMEQGYYCKIPRLQINYSAGNSMLFLQPEATSSLGAGVKLLDIRQAGIDGGAPILQLQYNGWLYFGDGGGSTTHYMNGPTWGSNGAGTNMTWDTGTGGNYAKVKAYGIQFINYNDGSITGSLVWSTNGYVTWNIAQVTTPVAFASLPAGVAGMRHFINNCSTTTFAAAADGAGANTVPVYHNGSSWRVG